MYKAEKILTNNEDGPSTSRSIASDCESLGDLAEESLPRQQQLDQIPVGFQAECAVRTNEEGSIRSMSLDSGSLGDFANKIEQNRECQIDLPDDERMHTRAIPNDPVLATFYDSFISCDSWGDLGYDKDTDLTQLSAIHKNMSSSRDVAFTKPRIKNSRDQIQRQVHQQQKQRRQGRSTSSERRKKRPASRRATPRVGSRFRDPVMTDGTDGSHRSSFSSYSSTNGKTVISDDGLDYFSALTSDSAALRSRAETREWLESEMTKKRSKSLEATVLVDRNGGAISDCDFLSLGASGDDRDSISAPSFITHGERQWPEISPYRKHLIESLVWFSFHLPKCVLEDLTTNESLHCQEIMNNPGDTTQAHESETKQNQAFDSSLISEGEDSMSSLSEDDGAKSVGSRRRKRPNAMFQVKGSTEIVLPQQLSHDMLQMPFTSNRECALVFVDISGFTKLSTILDEESLSKVINTYFRLLVEEVIKFGGDILKFAGDAFFAEWRVITNSEIDAEAARRSQNDPLTNLRASFLTVNSNVSIVTEARSIADCVLAASQCAASIVHQFSDFQIQSSRELSVSFSLGMDQQGKCDTMLNVHCGVGCGTLVGIHVGDIVNPGDTILETRREYLFLGDPIGQVSMAENMATEGEVYASPEAIQVLKQTCTLSSEMLTMQGPVRLAARTVTFFTPMAKIKVYTSVLVTKEMAWEYCETLVDKGTDLVCQVLERLHRQLSLYVHHVVRDDELDVTTQQHGIGNGPIRARISLQDRHIAEAELRLVYTMFINAKIDPKLTSDPNKDADLFYKLQSIMQVTCRELHKFSGHLRQFIIDDKGVVLIGTFGLRGSTFANMVTNHALPATFAIHHALKNEIGVDNKIGATLGKVYCGVVGGVFRHEFAVMGAPVNLAARLMYSKDNNGILVDEAAQTHADSRYAFKRLHPVEAKGYDKPVIIFEPLHKVNNKKRGFTNAFVGRRKEVTQLVDVAESILSDRQNVSTVMAFIIGEPGIGKTAVGLTVIEEMKLYANVHQKKIFCHRSTTTESDQRVPLSSFRRIFLCGIRERCTRNANVSACNDDNMRSMSQLRLGHMERRGSLRHLTSTQGRRNSIGRGLTKGLPSARRVSDGSCSMASIKSFKSASVPYLKQLCDVCEELNYPNEFAEIVGSQWLGLDGCIARTHVDGRIPSIDELVGFLANAYMRLTEVAHLTMIFLDDFQWIDSLTWKVIRVLCDEGKNILIMGAMRSQETNALRRMSSVASWHNNMQARKGIVEVNIGPLELSEVRSLISRVFDCDVGVIDDELCNDVYERTGGIAMYVIEVLEGIKRNQTVAIDTDSGKLKWTPQAEKEHQRIGSNNVAAIELSFLNCFDSLDRVVRRVLQTCAVLGMSFSLSDVIRFHPEMDELMLELSLNAAVDELILVEDVEAVDDEDMSYVSGKGSLWESRHVLPSWNTTDDRFFQFGHAMWRKSVLDAMLSEHKVHMYRIIAEAMEREQGTDMENIDIGNLLTLFDHWKSCGDFGKAAPLALSVGLRLEEWDLAAQSLDLYRDALEMCYESAGNPVEGALTRDENEVWLPASAPPATVESILRLYIRIAKCHSHLGEHEECATTYRDAHTIMTTSPKAAKLNADLVLPILSGLCRVALWKNDINSDFPDNSEELVESFLQEAIDREDCIHIVRALAMKASLLASFGNFIEAIKVQDELQKVYSVQAHSKGIQNEYGKDFGAQSCADSVQWYMLAGHRDKAELQIRFIIHTLLPEFDPRDIDTSLDILFPILIVLKSIHKAHEAETILFKYAINPFHDIGGFSTRWISLFNPCAYLFQIMGMIEGDHYENELLVQIQDWVLDPQKSLFNTELQYKGYALVGEICALLASFKSEASDDFHALLERGRMLLTRVVYAMDVDKSESFMLQQARLALETIELLDDDDSVDVEESGELRGTKRESCNDELQHPLNKGHASSIAEAASASSSRKFATADTGHDTAIRKCCVLL